MGAQVGLLGSGGIAAVGGGAHRSRRARRRRRTRRFRPRSRHAVDSRGLGVVPRTCQVENLDTMHPADPRIQRRSRQRRAPPRHRLGPLLGATQIDELVASFEQTAVDHAGPDRLQLVRQGGEHRLVEHGQTLTHACLFHQRPALVVHTEGDEGLVPEAGAEVLHPPRTTPTPRPGRQPAEMGSPGAGGSRAQGPRRHSDSSRTHRDEPTVCLDAGPLKPKVTGDQQR